MWDIVSGEPLQLHSQIRLWDWLAELHQAA